MAHRFQEYFKLTFLMVIKLQLYEIVCNKHCKSWLRGVISFRRWQGIFPTHVTENLPYFLSVVIVFLTWRLVIRNNRCRRQRDLREPPGPVGLPVIGNILQIRSEPPKAFMHLAKKFGGVIKLKIGSRPVIVLNGHHAIRQALVHQSVDFAGRPDFIGSRTLISLRGGSLAFSSYDECWKLQRKLADKALRHFTSGGQVSQFEQQVVHEATELIDFILGKNKTAVTVDVSSLLQFSASNVIANILFQHRHDLDHAELKKIVEESDLMLKEISGSNIINFRPWLRPFLAHKVKAFVSTAERFTALLEHRVKEHTANYKTGMDNDIFNYLKTLFDSIDIHQRKGVTEKQILSTVYDFFGAGRETVAATLTWAFLYVIYYPEIQAQVQAEIDQVVGRDRLPSLADREKLAFTEAFLVEAFRHSSVVPTTLPRATIRDTVLEGGFNYFIPKDTVVFVNLYSIQQDPGLWDNPDVFKPRRFLTEDGSKIDTERVDSLMRFGSGRRRCIGSDVAQIELFLFFTIMLHQCDLRNVANQNISLEGKGSLLMTKAPLFQMEVIRRC